MLRPWFFFQMKLRPIPTWSRKVMVMAPHHPVEILIRSQGLRHFLERAATRYILLVGNLRVIFLRNFYSLRMFWGPYKWYWDGPWTLLCPPRPIWSLWNRYPHPRDHLKASHRPGRPPKCGKISIFRKFDFFRFMTAQSQKLYWKSKLQTNPIIW